MRMFLADLVICRVSQELLVFPVVSPAQHLVPDVVVVVVAVASAEVRASACVCVCFAIYRLVGP